jgi:cell division protein FtsB
VTLAARSRTLALAAVLAVGLSACGGDDGLQEELEALRAATQERAAEEAELEARVEALEDRARGAARTR